MRSLAIIIIALLPAAQCTSCSNTLKQGPYKLQIPTQQLPNITRFSLRITKYNLSNDDYEVLIGYRSRWTSYCYNGGALDPNTGCYDHLIEVPPTQEELLKWGRLNKCETCEDYEDAWGSDSDLCLKDPKPCGKWHDRKEMTKRSTNNRFAHHVCELSWRCGFSSSKMPVILRVEEEPKLYLSLPNGSVILEQDFFHLSGDTSITISKKPNIKATRIEAKCVDERGVFWCVDPDTHYGFDLRAKEPHCLYGVCYQFGVVLTKPKRSDNYKLQHASLDDLKSVFVTEMLEIEDLKYTTLKMAQRIIMLEKTLMRTIISLAKIDDKLLKKILGGSFSTEFITEDSFFIKPCLQEPEAASNCIGNKIFSDGRWIRNDNNANCINLKNVQTIDLFKSLDIWLPEISEQKHTGTADDYTGWSFYANAKESLRDTMTYTRNGGKSTSLEDIVGMPKGSLLGTIRGLWGFSITSTLIIASVILLIFCFLKRI